MSEQLSEEERFALACDVASMVHRTADIARAERIARKIIAKSDSSATVCAAAIFLLSEMLSEPKVPAGSEQTWFDAVGVMLKAGIETTRELAKRSTQ